MRCSKHLVVLSLAGLAQLLPVLANAAVVDYGSLAVPSSLNYGQTYSGPLTQFYDDYLFTIPASTVNTIAVSLNLQNLLGIDQLQGRLYSGTASDITSGRVSSGLLQAWSTAIPISVAGTTGTAAIIDPISLGAGSYILEVRGNVTGLAGGSYSGVLNVAPVPIPAAAWLLGSGLAGLFALGRRRPRQAA